MEFSEQGLSLTLRNLAREGVPPSRLLREVVRQVGPVLADRQFLVRFVSNTFQFGEGEGYVIFGWLPDGTGELSDTQIDSHLSKRIEAARPRWDRT